MLSAVVVSSVSGAIGIAVPVAAIGGVITYGVYVKLRKPRRIPQRLVDPRNSERPNDGVYYFDGVLPVRVKSFWGFIPVRGAGGSNLELTVGMSSVRVGLPPTYGSFVKSVSFERVFDPHQLIVALPSGSRDSGWIVLKDGSAKSATQVRIYVDGVRGEVLGALAGVGANLDPGLT